MSYLKWQYLWEPEPAPTVLGIWNCFVDSLPKATLVSKTDYFTGDIGLFTLVISLIMFWFTLQCVQWNLKSHTS